MHHVSFGYRVGYCLNRGGANLKGRRQPVLYNNVHCNCHLRIGEDPLGYTDLSDVFLRQCSSSSVSEIEAESFLSRGLGPSSLLEGLHCRSIKGRAGREPHPLVPPRSSWFHYGDIPREGRPEQPMPNRVCRVKF